MLYGGEFIRWQIDDNKKISDKTVETYSNIRQTSTVWSEAIVLRISTKRPTNKIPKQQIHQHLWSCESIGNMKDTIVDIRSTIASLQTVEVWRILE